MYRTPEETACLLAVILNRSGQSRARVSTKTIKVLGRRKNLRSAFVVSLTTAMADRHEWLLSELDSGGFGAVQAKALEAAKPVTGKRYLTDDERKMLRRDDADLSAFESEAMGQQDVPDEDD